MHYSVTWLAVCVSLMYWLLNVYCRLIPIEELSVGQISVLKKLSLIKLTALIELYKAKSNM